MKKRQDNDQMTSNRDQIGSGRVRQICQNFLMHSDFGLAHRLQEEEFANHYDRNRQHSRESGLGAKTARVIEEEEKQAYLSKQLNFYQQKQKIEENDSAIAWRVQEEANSHSIRHRSSLDRLSHSDHDSHLSPSEDTSCDEQLARLLQEEEELLAAAAKNRSTGYSGKLV